MNAPRIDRIEGMVMAVNAFLVHGPNGIVVVDGMLTMSDARLVHQAVEGSGKPLAGLVITHPHPDHYAGAAEIIRDADVPIVATTAVDRVIRRDDGLKDKVVGPMMGAEWPSRRQFPTLTVEPDTTINLGGLELTVQEVGPGESPMDTIWWVDDSTAFSGDVTYNGMHAYLADGHWRQWLTLLDRLDHQMPSAATLHVGHGAPGTKALLANQRRYIEVFVDAVTKHADAIANGDHSEVVHSMQQLLPTSDLLFLMDLSIEPVAQQQSNASIEDV